MNVLDSIAHWPKGSIAFEELSISNVAGEVTETWTETGSVEAWVYTETTNLADQAGKLQIIEVHTFVFDPTLVVNAAGQTFDITNPLRIVKDGVYYYVEGKDNVLNNSQVQILKARRDAA